MNISNIIYWDVDRSVGVEVGRSDNEGVDSDIDDKVGSGDCKGFE